MRHSASSSCWPADAEAAGRRRGTAVRWLLDEQLSPRLAGALRALSVPAARLGDDDELAVGADDADVIAHCLRTARVVVSSSSDMVIMCAEEGQRVVWLDPWSREFTRDEQVVTLITHLQEIERLLADGAECVRVLRTRVEALEVEEAARLAGQRLRGLTITAPKKG